MKKIAIPITSNNIVENYFGQSRYFEIYTFSNANEIIDLKLLEAEEGCNCKSNAVTVLSDEGVKYMLSGFIGKRALQKLNNVGINVVSGCSGKSVDVILEYIEGNISKSSITCSYPHRKN